MTSRTPSISNSARSSSAAVQDDPDTSKKRRKITRSRDGCLTCRKRRKLCDLDRPSCKACVRLKLDCRWSGSFDHPRPPNQGPARHRTPSELSQDVASVSLARPTPSDPHVIIPDDWAGIMSGERDVARADQPQGHLLHTSDLSSSALSVPPYLEQPYLMGATPSRGVEDTVSSIFSGMDFDETTLQLWAAGCLTAPSTQVVDPFQSLSDLLFSSDSPPPTVALCHTPPRSSAREQTPGLAPTHHDQLLKHYQAGLSSLLSCGGDSESSPSAFAAFTQLAETSSSSEAGQALRLGILAWAGRHMVNQGDSMYEAVSERLGAKATKTIMTKLEEWKLGSMGSVPEAGQMTLLAGTLMIIQFKICRGDIWGFDNLMSYLRLLTGSLYKEDSPGAPPSSMRFSFFENLVYHDLLSSSAYDKSPLVPYSVLQTYSAASFDFLHTLTGVCFPLFCKMHRIASLTARRRSRAQSAWSDEQLYDFVTAADQVQQQLAEEKTQMEALIKNKPNLSSHRFLHEAMRVASLIALRSFVLCEAPSTFQIRLLVCQSLSLLEEMHEKSLPGLCSSHWALFVTALCCRGGRPDHEAESTGRTDCQRIERLYDIMFENFAFGHISRSRKVFREVWSQNQGGSVFVDWVDVVKDFDWELFVV